jgi:arylsulfatase A
MNDQYTYSINKALVMRISSILFLAFLLATCSCGNNPKENEPRQSPNIIYILADDLGYGDIEPFGQKLIKTPRLNQLAAEGMIFTDHYAGNTVCAPSRCSLMTGKHPGNAYVRGNMQYPPSGQLPLPKGTNTVSTILKEAGYTCGMIGKWGLGNIGNSGDPKNFGWDLYYGYMDQVRAHNYYPEFLIKNGEKQILNNKVTYLSDTLWHKGLGSYSTEQNDYSHDLFATEALNFIKESKDKPFFLYLPFTIPHDNGESLPNESMEVPEQGEYAEQSTWNKESINYAAMISRMDKDIGSIVDLLKELGIDNNTLLIFTSDNGPMPDMIFTDLFNSNGPLKGGKRDMYEGAIRIPFIAWWPGQIEPGTKSDHASAFWDFLPTACEIAGVDVPIETDGISFLPTLLGEKQAKHDYLYWESPLKGFSTAIRRGKWKAVIPTHNKDMELYDLSTDLGEKNNVASKHPEIIEEMEEIIKEAHIPSEHFPRPDETK